jgi:hypothetical protein
VRGHRERVLDEPAATRRGEVCQHLSPHGRELESVAAQRRSDDDRTVCDGVDGLVFRAVALGGSDLDNLDAQLDRLREILRGLTVEEPMQ